MQKGWSQTLHIKTKIKQKYIPVRPVASAVWNDAYDIRKNKAVSRRGNSRILVYFVSNAVAMPITEPIRNAPPKIPAKFPRALKKA